MFNFKNPNPEFVINQCMMSERNLVAPLGLAKQGEIVTLVENRKAYTLNQCELNVFETYQQSALVPLTFSDLVITSMLRGKK